jgi:hypothetical protein
MIKTDKSETKNHRQGFKIFRAAEAPTLEEAGCITLAPFAPEAMSAFMKLMESGFHEGEEIRVLVNVPGFSLTHVWFKKDLPLPLHSHDADCLYYIVAGSLKMGTEVLGPRDCFFVPEDAPYTYRPGPQGVELLEFRHKTQFNYVNHVHGAGFWSKAMDAVKANQDAWKTDTMPALNT